MTDKIGAQDTIHSGGKYSMCCQCTDNNYSCPQLKFLGMYSLKTQLVGEVYILDLRAICRLKG